MQGKVGGSRGQRVVVGGCYVRCCRKHVIVSGLQNSKSFIFFPLNSLSLCRLERLGKCSDHMQSCFMLMCVYTLWQQRRTGIHKLHHSLTLHLPAASCFFFSFPVSFLGLKTSSCLTRMWATGKLKEITELLVGQFVHLGISIKLRRQP